MQFAFAICDLLLEICNLKSAIGNLKSAKGIGNSKCSKANYTWYWLESAHCSLMDYLVVLWQFPSFGDEQISDIYPCRSFVTLDPTSGPNRVNNVHYSRCLGSVFVHLQSPWSNVQGWYRYLDFKDYDYIKQAPPYCRSLIDSLYN